MLCCKKAILIKRFQLHSNGKLIHYLFKSGVHRSVNMLVIRFTGKSWTGEGFYMYTNEHTIYVRTQNLEAEVHVQLSGLSLKLLVLLIEIYVKNLQINGFHTAFLNERYLYNFKT